MTAEPEWWGRALAQGDYLQALAMIRQTVNESEPISYDSVAYLLQAVGRFADADAVRRRRAELERPRGLAVLPKKLRAALRQASNARPADGKGISPARPQTLCKKRFPVVGS